MMITQRLSAHIGYLFTELPLEARVAAAADAGFTAIEHPQPYGILASRLAGDLERYGLRFSQIAAGQGDTAKGEKGLASLPGRENDFRESLKRAIDYALDVGCPLIHPMAGVPHHADGVEVQRTYLRNIEFAVELTAHLPLKVLIEAISASAVPGYYMSTLAEAAVVQDIFGPGNVALLVDTFHAAANGDDIMRWVTTDVHRVGHVHIADFPGRHEPGTGIFPFDEFLNALLTSGYEGAIGFEYVPSRDTRLGLSFLQNWKNDHLNASGSTAPDITSRGLL